MDVFFTHKSAFVSCLQLMSLEVISQFSIKVQYIKRVLQGEKEEDMKLRYERWKAAAILCYFNT